MVYVGSKNRIAKYILPLILKDRKPNQWYVEPFAGGFNTIDKVSGNRIANDINYCLTELFRMLQQGWIPPGHITEKEYLAIKTNKEKYPAYLVGFVGFNCSYAGKWFGGYARGLSYKGVPRNYTNEGKRNMLAQVNSIKNIIIQNKNYWEMQIPPESIIYCDPPYKGTTEYAACKTKFDHETFFEWCRKMSKQKHVIYVSEYDAPADFECLWQKEIGNSLAIKTGNRKGIEKLFKHSKRKI